MPVLLHLLQQRCVSALEFSGALPHASVELLIRRCKLIARLTQGRFRLLLGGDVARNLRRADEAAVAVFDRRDGERDVEQRSIPAAADRFEVIDPFAGTYPPQDGALL